MGTKGCAVPSWDKDCEDLCGMVEKQREDIRRMLAAAGTVKLHHFADGRRLRVSVMTKQNDMNVYWFCLSNPEKSFLWENGVGYYDLAECAADAEKVFGITEWNII